MNYFLILILFIISVFLLLKYSDFLGFIIEKNFNVIKNKDIAYFSFCLILILNILLIYSILKHFHLYWSL